jgi:hypothetical protein
VTDELIGRLADDLRPVHPRAMSRLLWGAVVASGLVAAIAMNMWLGMRPDMATAPMTMMFWSKFSYTLAIALLGTAATLVLARPDGRTRWPWLAAVGLLAVVLLLAVVQLVRAEPDSMMPLVFGGTAMICPWRIIVLSLPILFASILALRRFAPRSPTLAGLAAGVMSGGFGAWVYSFACAEDGMMFMALFYTLGIALVGGLGAVLGRYLLRW